VARDNIEMADVADSVDVRTGDITDELDNLGEFDVVTIGKVGKLRFLSNLPKVFKGTHVEEDEVRVFRTARLELSASRPFPVYADGEHLSDLPASLRILPQALRVIVPARAGE